MRDEILGDTPLEREEPHKNKRHKKANSAFLAASVARSAVAQAHRHVHGTYASTGTNISYEGATAPGAAGSVGTGYASGKAALDERISSYSEYEHMHSPHKRENQQQDDLPDDYSV
jgi:hypothetical protein